MARPSAPDSRPTVTSTVGLPRESSTSRPSTTSTPLTGSSALRRSGGSLRSPGRPLSAAQHDVVVRHAGGRFAHLLNGSRGGPSDPGIPRALGGRGHTLERLGATTGPAPAGG